MIEAHINSAASYHMPEKKAEMGQTASTCALALETSLKTNTERGLIGSCEENFGLHQIDSNQHTGFLHPIYFSNWLI